MIGLQNRFSWERDRCASKVAKPMTGSETLKERRSKLNINSIIPRLLRSSDNLAAIRRTLLKLLEGENDRDERYGILLSVLGIDIAYLTLFNEYEFLDTSNIIHNSYLNLYYTRRIEMPQKSKEITAICYEGLEDFSESITDELTLNKISRAKTVIQVSVRTIDKCVSILQEYTVSEVRTQLVY